MKRKKLKKKIKRLQKKLDWYHKRLMSDILSTTMREMTRK